MDWTGMEIGIGIQTGIEMGMVGRRREMGTQ